ncbi:permease [Leadbettera azotonutricia]|uniref:Putative membrane protein n=1 Tax=Leadbettera azotonutricia (strain ATCC BAA-888 / DSM 13862 / ZAS-9) TaxID=545695 RepID=F5YBF7_LEAAZ|nr:permease [Leadbettera azotonutricia]AEF81448.1 putative membrane protein [Leadbettera azotonutricia ZAS-9]
MAEALNREFVYLWYYFSIQLEQIAGYYVLGIVLGSAISVFGKEKIHALFTALGKKKLGIFGVVPASLIGIASPLCMYGTIPIAASFSEKGMRDDWLASFIMCSILLNPQLIIYSIALGKTAVIVRFVSCFLCGIAAGVLIRILHKDKGFFDFSGFTETASRDTDPNPLLRFLKNILRNIKATGLYFLIGIALSAVFQRYVPPDGFAALFGSKRGFGVLMAATIGVPLYACGGGTIPLLMQWLDSGMTMGAASAFMITGPATKITNLGAVKIVLGMKRFIIYILFSIVFAYLTGIVIDLII